MSAFVAAAFAAGLLGGVHCIGMCGGIAVALSASSRGSPWRRIAAFNIGRIASYATAGAIAGGVGAIAQSLGPAATLQLALFVVAHALVVMMGLYVAGWGAGIVRLEGAGSALWRRIEPLRRAFFPIDSDARALGAGAVWGWVPCGLVYGMLPLAAASGGVGYGALVLAAFGVGTLPGLLLAGRAALTLATVRRTPWVRQAAGLAIIGMGIAGIARLPQLADLIASGWLCLT
jgi:sulfite exporter TauE/SafE